MGIRRAGWIIGIVLGMALGSATPIAAAAAPDPQQAQQLVEDVTDQMLAVLKNNTSDGQVDLDRIRSKVEEIVFPHLDFVTMTKLAVGRHWRDASNDQKRALVNEFRTLLVRTYTKSLDEYNNQKLEFLPLRPSPYEDRVKVRSKVVQQGGPDIPVEYALRYHDGEWSVYDIVIDGVSLVTTYRSSFSSQIDQGSIDALIESLRKKNSQNESTGASS